MLVTILWRRKPTAEWQGYVLNEGEPGYDTDLDIGKVGDGVTPWEELPAFGQSDTSNLDASAIKTGTIDPARLPDLSTEYAARDINGRIDPSVVPDLSDLYPKKDATGVIPQSTIPDLSNLYLTPDAQGTIDPTNIPDLSATYVTQAEVGQPNGVPGLDASTKVSPLVIPDLSVSYDISGAASLVQDDLDDFKTQVPTIEDTMFTWFSGDKGSTYTGEPTWVVMTAPYDMTLLSATMSWDQGAGFNGITASDTDYYQVNLRSVQSTLVLQTTQVTGPDSGGGITVWGDWNFDSRVWSSRLLSKGKTLRITTTKFGAPPAFGGEFCLTVRYQREAAV